MGLELRYVTLECPETHGNTSLISFTHDLSHVLANNTTSGVGCSSETQASITPLLRLTVRPSTFRRPVGVRNRLL